MDDLQKEVEDELIERQRADKQDAALAARECQTYSYGDFCAAYGWSEYAERARAAYNSYLEKSS